MISSFLPITPDILKPFVNEDRIIMFTSNATKEDLYPPGYLFAWANLWEETVYTQLNWIAENRWDYRTNGPAKLGGAGWNDGATNLMFDAAEEYARVHADQFDWVGGHLTNFTFTWGSEVESLKDCDYVFIPTAMHTFAKAYSVADYHTTYLAGEAQTTFLKLITDAGLWGDIDGTLFATNIHWWGQGLKELYPFIDDLLLEYHPDEVQEIKQAGRSYVTAALHNEMCRIIMNAAEAVGPANVDS